jgi:hypothetical protein
VIILERHPVSGYELRHCRREPDDVLTRKVDVDILACPKPGYTDPVKVWGES